MTAVFTILIVIASIILILVVLVQKSKGGGLSSGFASSNAIMGVRKTTDFIEKATWGLASFIIVLSIACVMIQPKRTLAPSTQVTTPTPAAPADATTDFSTGAPLAPPTAAPTAPQIPADNQENNN